MRIIAEMKLNEFFKRIRSGIRYFEISSQDNFYFESSKNYYLLFLSSMNINVESDYCAQSLVVTFVYNL